MINIFIRCLQFTIKNKKLGGINICDNFWIDIDTPDSLNQCNIYLKNSNLF